MKKISKLNLALVALAIGLTQKAGADAVVDWNIITGQTIPFARDYNEVKALGPLVNSTRTPEQTDIAYFYADNAFLYWNRALQGLANTYLDNIGDSARLFALVSLVAADGPITAWDSKRYFHLWRPITATNISRSHS